MQLSDFPIIVHNDILVSLQALNDPDELEHDYETVFNTILTFASPSVTPGKAIYEQMLAVWVDTQSDKLSSLIFSTLVQLFQYNQPGGDNGNPLLWNPTTPRQTSSRFLLDILRICTQPLGTRRTQKRINAEGILKYFVLLYEYDLESSETIDKSLLCTFLAPQTDSSFQKQIVRLIFVGMQQDQRETECSLLLLAFLELTLRVLLARETHEEFVRRMIAVEFDYLPQEGKEFIMKCFPDGDTKISFLSILVEEFGILTDSKLAYFKDEHAGLMKLCSYFYFFSPRTTEMESFFYIILFFLGRVLYKQDKSSYPKAKVNQQTKKFLAKTLKTLSRTSQKQNRATLQKIELLSYGYCRS